MSVDIATFALNLLLGAGTVSAINPCRLSLRQKAAVPLV